MAATNLPVESSTITATTVVVIAALAVAANLRHRCPQQAPPREHLHHQQPIIWILHPLLLAICLNIRALHQLLLLRVLLHHCNHPKRVTRRAWPWSVVRVRYEWELGLNWACALPDVPDGLCRQHYDNGPEHQHHHHHPLPNKRRTHPIPSRVGWKCLPLVLTRTIH